MFKLTEFSNAVEKQKAAETVKEELLAMKNKIPVIGEFEVGINITENYSAYDVVINSTFDNPGDLEIYQLHPDHLAFIAFNKKYSERKAVVDYIF